MILFDNSSRKKDYTGLKKGFLTAVKPYHRKDSSNKTMWYFKCDCGTEKVIRACAVFSGSTSSCGCASKKRMIQFNKIKIIHGFTGKRFYKIWLGIKARCGKHRNYLDVKLCKRWNNFLNFKKDMYKSYLLEYNKNNHITIDRINPFGDYEKGNCRWVTMAVQLNNKRNSRKITYLGETKTIAEWCKEYNMQYKTLQRRLDSGIGVERSLLEPIRSRTERWYKLC